ncbi:hypothetical protein ACFRKC_39095, partial [Streptomyces chartreusis]
MSNKNMQDILKDLMGNMADSGKEAFDDILNRPEKSSSAAGSVETLAGLPVNSLAALAGAANPAALLAGAANPLAALTGTAGNPLAALTGGAAGAANPL